MTLKEFVKAFMEANGIDKDVDEMCKHIGKEASKLAENGCAVLDEDQVEKIVLGAKLEAPKPKPVEHKEIKVVKLEEPKPKPEPKPKKDDGQIDIFSLGVGLYD